MATSKNTNNTNTTFNTKRGRGEGQPSRSQYADLFVAFCERDAVKDGIQLFLGDGTPLAGLDDGGNPVFCAYTAEDMNQALEEFYYASSKEAEKTNPDGSVWRRILPPQQWLVRGTDGSFGGWEKLDARGEWVPVMNPSTGAQMGLVDAEYADRLARSVVWERVLSLTPAQVQLFGRAKEYQTQIKAMKTILKPFIASGRVRLVENTEKTERIAQRNNRIRALDGAFGMSLNGDGTVTRRGAAASSTTTTTEKVVEVRVEVPTNIFESAAFKAAFADKVMTGEVSPEQITEIRAAVASAAKALSILGL